MPYTASHEGPDAHDDDGTGGEGQTPKIHNVPLEPTAAEIEAKVREILLPKKVKAAENDAVEDDLEA